MFLHRVVQQLLTSREIHRIWNELDQGKDCTLNISQSARPFIVAARACAQARPILLVVSGEDAADRAARILAGWLGPDVVFRYPNRADLPWSDKGAGAEVCGKRAEALFHLAQPQRCVVVASARALLRRLPPTTSSFAQQQKICIGNELDIYALARQLVLWGYVSTTVVKEVAEPGYFCVHGDSIDVFSPCEQAPVRISFFGDEVDEIRKVVPSTGQTISSQQQAVLYAARELELSPATIQCAKNKLYDKAQEDLDIERVLDQIEESVYTNELDAYLPYLYPSTASVIDYMHSSALVVLAEPRALFDDCQHAYDELMHTSTEKRASLDGLYTSPVELDFGKQQRLSLSSLARQGMRASNHVVTEQCDIAGSASKMIGRIRELLANNTAVVFSVPDRGARRALQLSFTDENISFEDVSEHASKRAPEHESEHNQDLEAQNLPLPRNKVVFFADPINAGIVIPSAHLAIFSVSDLNAHLNNKKHRFQKIDPTKLTFPFKPGDYVVHATHGIALFQKIVQQEVAGKKRDYFLLTYAQDDKLYVPFEQVDKITRYIGPDGSTPRLTRLNSADWSRACTRARKSAQKMAFDLVDLYTRRSTIKGFSFSFDTPAQEDMETSFPYTLTRDQSRALDDIKADMQSATPMDRLLCGDVGFGKTEVALRAAFKCCQDHKQVMVLCPTTILAQQHFETFYERFTPFEVNVRVLSRFIKPAEQKRTLEGFSTGDVDVLIGTHRLLSSDVNPSDLGLIIIDEEQRFGVQHKEQLKNIREQVDVLTLSATPIPRTMQMAMSGVRDMSLILSAPAGRKPVRVHVGEWDSDLISDAIRLELARKGQVYYVSNRVKTIDDALERVHACAPEARVGVAHGQMSPSQIEEVMLLFEEHEIDVLVATTIIESGIDNPHTNTLIIEDSQRLGLAQLYQLKGRVGRGRVQAYAYFMFPPTEPLTEEARRRLEAIYEHQELGSGMRIAMKDLEIRGAGSLMGAEQHGNLSGVGFDLFTQMLSDAVREAKGETQHTDLAEVVINIPADFYFSEDYVPEIDKRVLLYRRLAAATELSEVDALEKETLDTYGVLEPAGVNLFGRARIRIRAARLGVQTVSALTDKIILQGLEVPYARARLLRAHNILVYPKTKKVIFPVKRERELERATQRIQEASKRLQAAQTHDLPQETIARDARSLKGDKLVAQTLQALEEFGDSDDS